MKKTILNLIFLISAIVLPLMVYADQTAIILNASVSVDKVPKGFFGTWRVTSVQTSTTNPFLYTGTTQDYWNISRVGNVLTLSNPVSGARASLNIKSVVNKTMQFEKVTKSENEISIETPTLNLDGENFTGRDVVVIETYKYGKFIKKDKIEYKLRGEKVSGNAIKELLNIGTTKHE